MREPPAGSSSCRLPNTLPGGAPPGVAAGWYSARAGTCGWYSSGTAAAGAAAARGVLCSGEAAEDGTEFSCSATLAISAAKETDVSIRHVVPSLRSTSITCVAPVTCTPAAASRRSCSLIQRQRHPE